MTFPRPRRFAAYFLAFSVVLSALTVASSPAEAKKSKVDVRYTRGFFVDLKMPAAVASRTDKTFAPIGGTPQALWLTDYYAPGKVKRAAYDYAIRANKAKKTPIVAIYAIPGRDCGMHSAGGFDAATYKVWINEVAKGLKGRKAIAILEPDAVPWLGDCQGQGDRAGLLTHAAKTLSKAGVWVYVDAGHSNWQNPSTIADRLVWSGVGYTRGFSLNVGNYRWDATEVAYGKAVVAELKKRGMKNPKYLIETARNGAGPSADGYDVCNPPNARIGRKPARVFKGSLDAFVWIKHPGESDGACYDGPGSGQWWPLGALRLMGKA